MSGSPKTFEDFKTKMKEHWKEKISTKESLKKSSTSFYSNLFQEYATNCLFLELLDFQIHVTENLKNIDFNEFFKKQKQSETQNFPFIFPSYEHINVTRSHRIPNTKSTQFNRDVFIKSLHSFYKKEEAKTDLINFLKENPIFDYYFWNVTFPNIFLGFVSNDYCQKAVDLICSFESDIETFVKAIASFINHNYYFQDSFLKTYFIISQNENDIDINIQQSLIKSIQKLNIHQIDILIKIIKDHPKEAIKMFLNDIIIRNIKLWKYSPIFSPSLNNKNQYDQIDAIITHLNEKFIDEQTLKDFLQPVFESIESRITINDINLNRLVFNDSHKLAITLLDILIIVKFADSRNRGHYSALLEKFNNCFLLKKAFSYFYAEIYFEIPQDMDKEAKDKLTFDQNTLLKWNNYKQDAIKYNRNPLEILCDDKKRSKLEELDPQVALAGIATSYYSWYEFTETKEVLKQESRVLIVIKDIIESQKSIIDIFTSKFTLTRPIEHGDFVQNMKNLYITLMKKIMLKFITTSFKVSSEFEPEEADLLLKEARNVLGENINNELSNKFNEYFNCSNSPNNLLKFYTKQKSILRNQIMKQNVNVSENDHDLVTFKQFFNFMEHFTRAYLISYYNDESLKLVLAIQKIDMPNFDSISEEYFSLYSSSGIFSYISNFVNNVKSDDFENTKMIQVGKVFAAIPVVNKFLGQFISSQYTDMLLRINQIENEDKLTMLLLGYAFKFYNSNPEERITEFIKILSTAYNELSSFNNCLPYFTALSKEFEFLNRFIPSICSGIDKS